MSEDKAWKSVGIAWRDVVLVCRKCSKKLDGGFGTDGDEAFAKALRRVLDGEGVRKVKARRRRVGIVEVGCLDLCPKRAVVVVKGSDPASMLIVPEGAGMGAVVERLGLRRGAGEGLAEPRPAAARRSPASPVREAP